MYLFYQAILMVLASGKSTYPADRQSRKKSLAGIYRQGAITNILNPKVALFFMALLPQFILPASPNKPLSFILLGLVFITTGTGWCLFLALLPLFSAKPCGRIPISQNGSCGPMLSCLPTLYLLLSWIESIAFKCLFRVLCKSTYCTRKKYSIQNAFTRCSPA